MRPIEPLYGVSWREWAGVLAICTISGTALGVLSFWARIPGLPVPYLPFVLVGAFVVALCFALVASVFGAILLILVAQYIPQPMSKLRLAATGAVAGAVVGALHPFVLLVVLIRALSPESAGSSIVSLASLVALSGAVAGAIICPRYVPAVRARRAADPMMTAI